MTILSALNTFSEVLIATLPIPVIFQINMEPRQRWSVISLVSLGFLVAVVGIIRTVFIKMEYDSNDPTWMFGPYWICSEVEISVAMVSYKSSSNATSKDNQPIN
jgi:hypothetical protein